MCDSRSVPVMTYCLMLDFFKIVLPGIFYKHHDENITPSRASFPSRGGGIPLYRNISNYHLKICLMVAGKKVLNETLFIIFNSSLKFVSLSRNFKMVWGAFFLNSCANILSPPIFLFCSTFNKMPSYK